MGRKLNKKRFVLVMISVLLSFPVHEFGHYIIAVLDGVEIQKANFIGLFNGTHFINPSITVNEFTFSSPLILILYNLGGLLITIIAGLIVSVILRKRDSTNWVYPYSWVVVAPLASLSDIDHIFYLLGLSNEARWMHVILGALTFFMYSIMRKEVREEKAGV